MKLAAFVIGSLAFAAPAGAAPPTPAVTTVATAAKRKPFDPKKLGAVARVGFGRELRPAREVVGRRTEPLTGEEATAASIQKLLRGPLLRRGVTGLFVADAKTGEPMFAVNADDPLNPASNVKLISTATAIELLGADFRYPTRVLGAEPKRGVVHGDIYLLGSYDPTLTVGDFDGIAAAMAARGITQIDGGVVIGADPTRDGIYRSVIPVPIVAGEPGAPPTVNLAGFDLVTVKVIATTARKPMNPRLTYKTELATTPAGLPRITLTIGGVIGHGGSVDYPLWTKQRTAVAAYSLIAALRAHQIGVTGELRTMELGDFVGESVTKGALPVELGRHESAPVGEIVSRINKWSINWLADRLVMTAAGLARRQPPSMELAVEAMYAWLDRRPHIAKSSIVIDTGSGLSYRTQISPHEIVSVLRSAGGFAGDADPRTARAWMSSLSVAGTDGTLRYRFRNTDVQGRIIGKTGSLSTVIALSGILEVDPQRPLVFSIVTNTDVPLAKAIVRKAHEQVIAEICKYVAKTSSPLHAAPERPIAPAATPAVTDETTDEPASPDSQLDHETVDHP